MSRRLLCIAVACFVVATIGMVGSSAGAAPRSSKLHAVPGGIRQLNTVHGFKSDSGRLARSDRSLFRLKGSKLTPVIVKLDYDAMAAYRGYLPGYAATSPGVTHKSLKANKAAVDSYGRYIGKLEDRARAALTRLVPKARVTQSFRVAYGGFSALVPADQISKLLEAPGVVAVQRDHLNHLESVQEPYQYVGADQVWPSLGGLPNAGSNVTLADLDSGIYPENPMLADNGTIPAPVNGPYACEFGDGSPGYGPSFTCNNKLVGAHVDLTTYLAVIGALPDEYCLHAGGPCSARDSEGHGTHTATTAAGDFVDHAPIFGIDRGPTSGLAPGAHVIAYRICLVQGCFTSDTVAAVGQAITDGANVINFSISGGRNPFTDAGELAFRDFYASGGLVNASAGNSGPGPATSDHASPWENTVGASYSSRLYLTTLHLVASNGDTADFTGSSITQPISSATPVVMATAVAGHASDATCSTAFAGGSVTGQVVVCARGNPAGRAASSFNVMQGGAAGMILYNPTHQDLFTDNFWVPTVMLDGGTTPQIPHDTTPFLNFMSGHTGVTATWVTGAATNTPNPGDVMTTFSSRGPLGDWIKPDITAPGIEILAGNSALPAAGEVASGPPGENFQAIAGTSMSAPHASGVALLVFSSHPTWTPGQVKSAMMTSAVQDVLKPDGVTPADPFNDGSGSIRANRAVKPTVTFDESAADYAALASDTLGRIDANLPSIDAPTMPGSVTTTRTMKNVTSNVQPFVVTTTATGGSISVEPSSFTIQPGGTKTITITIHGESLAPGQQYFGGITLNAANAKSTDVYIPVAWFEQQGAVSLSAGCRPATFPKGSTTSCTTVAQNQSTSPAATGVEEHFAAANKLSHQNFHESHNAASSGSLTSGADGYDWSGTLSPTVAPLITNFDADPGPAGYLPLSAFGIPAVGGVGDETISNFNVPAFSWGHEAYTRIGIVSDGYIVIGGGSGPDVQFEPTAFPNPARPNNVIAPLWTDLNPGAGGAVRIGTLTDGSDSWIVIDFAGVPYFGFAAPTQSFEIWIGVNSDADPSEDVSYVYGSTGQPVGAPPLNAGAENRDGTSGQNAEVLGVDEGWRITTGSPMAGGSVTITYDVLAKKAGSFTLTTNMTSDLTPGTTVSKQQLTVT